MWDVWIAKTHNENNCPGKASALRILILLVLPFSGSLVAGQYWRSVRRIVGPAPKLFFIPVVLVTAIPSSFPRSKGESDQLFPRLPLPPPPQALTPCPRQHRQARQLTTPLSERDAMAHVKQYAIARRT